MTDTALTQSQPKSITEKVATRYGMSGPALQQTLAKTIFPNAKAATNEQVAALLIVADQYDLNPFTKEIYAFPQGGGIVPIVGVDGWYKLLHRDPNLSGVQVEFNYKDSTLFSATARIYKKDWEHPIEVTELMEECKRNTPAWKNQPHRMLRHRALAQCIRIACGLSGLYMEEEAINFSDIHEVTDAQVVESVPTIDIKAAKEAAQKVKEEPVEQEPHPVIDDIFNLDSEE